MKCVRCKSVELTIETRGEGVDIVEVDVCYNCHGIWLDKKELNAIDNNFFVDIEDADFSKVAATLSDKSINCPRCDDAPQLNKVTPKLAPTVIIDVCPSCKGYWLDRGEINKMRDVSDQLLVASLLEE